MEKLNVEKVKEVISDIKRNAGDFEVQHIKEIALMSTFIEQCSQGKLTLSETRKLAKEIVKTKEIDFIRVTA